ncbi:MAG: LPD23 domain-containing protein [Filomicrobium sp.]
MRLPVRASNQNALLNLATFVSEGSQSVPPEVWSRAKDLEAGGATPKEVWDQTGVYRDKDGRLLFEVPDNEASLRPGAAAQTGVVPLGNVLSHPELFEHYPALEGTPVHISPPGRNGVLGSTTMNGERMEVSAPEDRLLDTLLHETQHLVDRQGTGAREFIPPMRSGNAARQMYYRSPGETRAFNVERKRKFTPEQRQAFPPIMEVSRDGNQTFLERSSDDPGKITGPDSQNDELARALYEPMTPDRMKTLVGELGPSYERFLPIIDEHAESHDEAVQAGANRPLPLSEDLARPLYDILRARGRYAPVLDAEDRKERDSALRKMQRDIRKLGTSRREEGEDMDGKNALADIANMAQPPLPEPAPWANAIQQLRQPDAANMSKNEFESLAEDQRFLPDLHGYMANQFGVSDDMLENFSFDDVMAWPMWAAMEAGLDGPDSPGARLIRRRMGRAFYEPPSPNAIQETQKAQSQFDINSALKAYGGLVRDMDGDGDIDADDITLMQNLR